ncbi:hypothetical protein [Virgibacillus doumboii]|uniref:hypothetical protein n=1 Tax=Virgibacillus doumboii TaxID=2697503 RepID=UPI0013E02ABF|nr:hypothetical protein [Virgibacillus doumboii]
MNKTSRWVVAILLVIAGILMLNKGLDLWSLGTDVDGTGIGVHFLIFEINDAVHESTIPSYAMGFFAASVISLLVAVIVGRKALQQ